MKKRILFVTKFIPAPAYGGGLKRNLAWIKFLSKYYDVDVIGYYNKNFSDTLISELKPYVGNLYAFNFKRNLLSIIKAFLYSLCTKQPVVNQQYFSKKISKKIKKESSDKKYEFVFFAEIATTIYKKYINGLPYYFDDHNVEYELIERTSKYARFPFRLMYIRDAKLMKNVEKCALENSKFNFFVSERDKEMFCKKIKENSRVVNNTYEDCKDKQCKISKNPSIIFVGSLSWKPNKDGIIHFLNNVYPKIYKKNSNVEFYIIGSNLPIEIKKFDGVMNVKIYENATETEKRYLIDKSWLCVAPIFFGSGTRIKILEYWSHSKVVVSSVIGAEGLIKSEGTFVEKNDVKMAERINKILSDKKSIKRLGNLNYICFKKNYDEVKVYEDSLYNTIFAK